MSYDLTVSLLLETFPSSRFLISISILLHLNIANCVAETSNNDAVNKILQERFINRWTVSTVIKDPIK